MKISARLSVDVSHYRPIRQTANSGVSYFYYRFAFYPTGTLIAVYGFWVTPIGWEAALWIWIYALLWFLINDAVKMWIYRALRRGLYV